MTHDDDDDDNDDDDYKVIPRTAVFLEPRLKKKSVIGLPEFNIINMVENCHQPTIVSKENMFFEDYFLKDDSYQTFCLKKLLS